MPETIRDIIKLESEELRYVEQLGPIKASEKLVKLASLLASLNAYIAEKRYWYNIKRQELLKEHGTAVKARIHAEATPEWKELNEAAAQGEALEEIIRSVKYYLRAAGEELKIG